MAVRLGHAKARGYAARRKAHPMAEINVTPMVDVMLVLLVIFMVTAPLLTVGVPVDLPKTKAEAMTNPDEPLVVSVKKDGSIFLNETPIQLEQLGPRLQAIIGAKQDQTVYVRGDKDAVYGAFAQVLAELQAGGITKVGLITDSKDTDTSPPSGGKSDTDKSKPKSN